MAVTKAAPMRAILLLRAIAYWLFFAVTVGIFGTAIILGFALPFKWRYMLKRIWARINVHAMTWLLGLRHEIEGSENIPETPAIIFAKHQSTYETIIFIDMFHPIAWVLKRELLWIPVFGWALALTGPTPINRKAGTRAIDQVIKQGTRSLKKGRWVVIFPEGTRKLPGSPPNYRIGGGILASKSGYPVLPIAHNAGEFWPRGSFLKWPGTITFSIGPLITSENKSPEEIMNQAKDWIENKMQQISDPQRWNRS